MSSIKPGSRISLEIVATPRTHGGRTTLARLCRKDPGLVRHHKKQTTVRPSWENWRRGGMTWHHQMKSAPKVKFNPGSRFTILATYDVIQDLASIEKFVKVSPA